MKKKMTKVWALLLTAVMALSLVSFSGGAKVKAAGGGYVLQDKSVSQLMAEYSVIAFDTLSIETHFHGNYLVKNLKHGSNSGLRASYGVAEDFYFETLESLSNGDIADVKDNATLHTAAKLTRNGSETFVTTTTGESAKIDKPSTVISDADIAAEEKYEKYADMDAIQSKFIAYNKGIAAQTGDSANVDVDITSDMNNRKITVKSGAVNVISLKYSDMTQYNNPIRFKFSDYTNDDILVMNIDLSGVESALFGSLILANESGDINNAEENYNKKYNRTFFNFYDSSAPDGQYTGSITFNERGFGTVIAPKANVVTNSNWDGTVVAGIFANKSGEYHRVNGTAFPTTTTTEPEEPKTADGTFSKTSVASTSELPGAKLSITADTDLSSVSRTSGPEITISADKKTISWTSTKEALVLSKLPSGKYKMTETTAPKGYKVAETIEFSVGGEDFLDAAGNKLDGNKIVMKDAAEETTTEKATTEKATTEKATTEKATTEKATTEKATTEKATTEKATTEKATTEKTTEGTTYETTTEDGTTERATVVTTTEEVTTEDADDETTTEDGTTEDADDETTSEEVTTEDADDETTTEDGTTEDVDDVTTEEGTTERTTGAATTEKTTTEKSATEETEVGSLIITITDSKTLAPIPNAEVVIRNVDTGKEYYVKTNKNGVVPEAEYPVGDYEIEVTSVPDGYVAPATVTAKVLGGGVTDKKLTVSKSDDASVDKTTQSDSTDGTTGTSSTESATTAHTDNTKPQTGDSAKLLLFAVLLVLSAAGVVVIIGKKREEK